MATRTIKFFNPSERTKAKAFASKYKKVHPGKKVTIRIHPKWHTLDVRTVTRKKPKKRGFF